MKRARYPGVARLTLALGLLTLGLLPAPAQRAPAPSPSAPAPAKASSPAGVSGAALRPLSSEERKKLQDLFTKVRPATVRIEQCPINDCSDPDGIGTAFLISEDGLALTAYHVIFQAQALSARTLDRKLHRVTVVGYDDQYDLALLKIDVPRGTPFLPLAKAKPAIGDPALAVGNGGGTFLRFKVGRFTALDSDAGRADFPPGTLELSAPLIPGDSGGPILNLAGEVAGVVSYIRVRGQDQNDSSIRAYAVPVSVGDARVADLRRGTKRDAPVIGIALTDALALLIELPGDLFAEASERLGLDLGSTPGAFFTAVTPGSPAAAAGLQPLAYDQAGKRVSGDIVTAVNGKRIYNFSDFQFAVRQYAPGDTVTLSLIRAGKPIQVKLKLTGRSRVAG